MYISENRTVDPKEIDDDKLSIRGSSVTIDGDINDSALTIKDSAKVNVNGSVNTGGTVSVNSNCELRVTGTVRSKYFRVDGGEATVEEDIVSDRYIRVDQGGELQVNGEVLSRNGYVLAEGFSTLEAGSIDSGTGYVRAETGSTIEATSIRSGMYVMCSSSKIKTDGNITCKSGYVSCKGSNSSIKCSGSIMSDSVRERNGGVIIGLSRNTETDRDDNSDSHSSTSSNTDKQSDEDSNDINPNVSDEDLVIWIQSLFKDVPIRRDAFKNLTEAYPNLANILRNMDDIYDVVRLCRQNEDISLTPEQIDRLEEAYQEDIEYSENSLKALIDEVEENEESGPPDIDRSDITALDWN